MKVYIEKKPNTIRFFYCACDSSYFQTYTRGLMGSAHQHKNYLHVHVINPTNEDLHQMKDLRENEYLSFSYEYTVKASRADFASNRFHSLPEFIDELGGKFGEVMVIDADGFFMSNAMHNPWFPSMNAEVGLFFREPLPGTTGMEYEATHVAAGAVYVNGRGLNFVRRVSQRLEEANSSQWFIDQLVLWNTYKEFKTEYNFVNIPFEFIDWEFSDNSYIWTGKGPRKDENKEYLEKFYDYCEVYDNGIRR